MRTLIIKDNQTLKAIKAEFNNHFPHLKIEFFSVKHFEDEASPRTAIYDDNLHLSDIRKNHEEGELSIDGHQKTSTFEQNFSDMFGVNVQVYRKSGNLWLQTITTDAWTLSEQEKKGIQMES
jgi:hypothetical protein